MYKRLKKVRETAVLTWRKSDPGGRNGKEEALGLERPGLFDTQQQHNGTPLQYSCLENPMDGGAG